jgi:hypothetical protein
MFKKFKKEYKIFTCILILVFLAACIKTEMYISPYEQNALKAANTVVFTLDDGTEVSLHKVSIKEDKFIGITSEKKEKEILLNRIRSVRIVKLEKQMVYLFGAVAVLAGGMLIGSLTAPDPPPSESCPFIFSFNGREYVFDAEPYGAAISRSLKRADWCELEHIKEVDGEYRLRMENFLDETQYTDEFKLMVVDHPAGSKVAPGISGEIHTISKPASPLTAFSSRGEDLLAAVSRKDEEFWESRITETNIERIDDARDELILEFTKPKGARTAKLLVNACTSYWGARMGRTFLNLYGNRIQEWYDEVDRKGPAYYKTLAWYINEGLYMLKIQVDTGKGWEVRGTMLGGGPFVSKDRLYVLDVSDIPGETLRIKLEPAVNFWRIDYMGVEYTEDQPVSVQEIEAVEAIDHTGRDVKESLKANDALYHVMPEIGDSVEFRFPAPEQVPGWERTIILKAVGYYIIHLRQELGEPRLDIIRRFHTEPGFTAQFALKEYMKWKGENESRRY